jgi:hypothetical protein
MWAVEVLKEWHDFYILVGTAGATLLGLLFVAVSLGAGYLTEKHQLGTRTFMSPVVVHFTSVFFLSAVALFPSHQPKFLAALIGATALIGAVISTYITIQVVRTDMTNYIQDYLAYGLLPSVAYLVLLVAAVSIYLSVLPGRFESDGRLQSIRKSGCALGIAYGNFRIGHEQLDSIRRREESRCRIMCEIFLLAGPAVHCRQMSMLPARECSAEKATTGPWGMGSDRTA